MTVKRSVFVIVWVMIALVFLTNCQSSGGGTFDRAPANNPAPTPVATIEADTPAVEAPAPLSAPDEDSSAFSGERFSGSVKWFDPQKGYGFIQSDEQDVGDIFVHFSGIEGEGFRVLEEGQKVEFSIEDSSRGPAAVSVVVLGP